ncbi:MAG: hypothetical protein U9N35_08710 [Euryarchaeota archaeon]|nr:hypothetical protein [Euryarchaeota archaeon]
MKRNYLVPLAILCLFAMCIGTPTESNATKKIAKTTPEPIEVRPGVYMTNDPSALPLPTEGYDVYVIGERHGIYEIHQLFLAYIKMLHEANGLRDVILEAPLYDEEAVNEYVYGLSDTLPRDCRLGMEEVLSPLREFNASLSVDEKIRVHFVDADNWIIPIHQHLQSIEETIGAPARNIETPPLEEFEECDEEKMLELVDRLVEVAESDAVLYELNIVERSVQRLFATTGKAIIRESIIAENIQYVLKELDGPLLALYGASHASKSRIGLPCRSWVHRLTESCVSVYSLFATGISGEARSPTLSTGILTLSANPDYIVFPNDTTLGDMFDENLEYNIVYIDLSHDANQSVKVVEELGGIIPVPAPVQVKKYFDGLIIFREVTPLQIGGEK